MKHRLMAAWACLTGRGVIYNVDLSRGSGPGMFVTVNPRGPKGTFLAEVTVSGGQEPIYKFSK